MQRAFELVISHDDVGRAYKLTRRHPYHTQTELTYLLLQLRQFEELARTHASLIPPEEQSHPIEQGLVMVSYKLPEHSQSFEVLRTRSEEELARLLLQLAEALGALQTARHDEGRTLETVLSGHIDTIEQLTREAAASAAVRIDTIRDRLAAKFAELIEGDLPEDRLAQEAAALAVKMDVREELDRLEAHIASARELLAAGSPTGRKLDFLSQEFNREANTLCSKSSDSSLTQIGLAIKNAVDQFREQVQNVE